MRLLVLVSLNVLVSYVSFPCHVLDGGIGSRLPSDEKSTAEARQVQLDEDGRDQRHETDGASGHRGEKEITASMSKRAWGSVMKRLAQAWVEQLLVRPLIIFCCMVTHCTSEAQDGTKLAPEASGKAGA